MAQPVIKVEGISKQFIISHETNERYKTLRDEIAQKAKRLLGRGKDQPDKSEEFNALQDISFEVHAGERIGIIGRNGAGKSTLLKILSRITEPTKGRISIRGRIASLLEVGTGFHPELTGRENIFLNGAILGMSRIEIRRKFDEIVAFAEVDKFLDTPVKRYSSGMYVRLAFAVAAHLEPEILIIDEVLAVGDMQFQKKCLTKMEDVSKNDGRTILFVSHNMQVINNFCDSSILLNSGRIVKTGLTNEITNIYLNQFRQFSSKKSWTPEEKSREGIWLQSIEILDKAGNNCEKFLLQDDIYIKITFSVTDAARTVCHSLAVLNNDDSVAFVSISQSDALYKAPLSAGAYSIVCRIPGNLLNSGSFWLITNISDEGHKVIVQTEREISFEVFDDGLARGGYYGAWNGVVRPALEWETRKDGN